VSKETYYSVSKAIACSRSLYSTVSKETYCSVKRDLLQCFEGDSVPCRASGGMPRSADFFEIPVSPKFPDF
jgi:hypothetical protein